MSKVDQHLPILSTLAYLWPYSVKGIDIIENIARKERGGHEYMWFSQLTTSQNE